MIGTTVDGRYVIESVLGRGGMAIVYRARDERLDRTVALKVATAITGVDCALVQRFRREFRACIGVVHPNVVRLYDFGELPDGSHYFTMEHLEGVTLQQYIQLRGQLDEALAQTMAVHMARALECIHGLGVIHRDLKPSNVMLVGHATGDSRAVVMDFGLARDAKATTLTKTGTYLGTPFYMSPELAWGERVDERSDIFQLGCVIYEMLTGEQAFFAENLTDALNGLLHDEPTSIRELRPECAATWDPLVRRCLAKARDDRFQSASELVAATEDLATHARERVEVAVGLVPAPKPKARWNLAAVAAALTLVGMLVGVFVSRSVAPAVYTVRDLQVVPRLTTAEVTWQSDEAYPSVVMLSGPKPLAFEGDGGEATRHHRVVVGGLEEGSSYEIRIRYPTGKESLPRELTTGKFAIEILEARETKSGVRLSWRATPTGVGEVALRRQGVDGSAIPIEEGPRSTSYVLLEELAQDTESLSIRRFLPDGTSRSVALGPILDSQVRALCGRLRGSDLESLAEDCVRVARESPAFVMERLTVENGSVKVSADELERRKEENAVRQRAKLTRFVGAQVQQLGVLQHYERAVSLSRLVLGTRLLPLDSRLAFYEQLMRVYRLSILVAFEGATVQSVRKPCLGSLALDVSPMAGTNEEIPVYRSQGTRLTLGRSGTWEKRQAVSRWTGEVAVSRPETIESAELCFEGVGLVKVALCLQLNGRLRIPLYSFPLPVSRNYSDSPFKLYQQIPPELLAEGTNRVVLELHPLLGRYSWEQTSFDAMTLRFRRY